MAYYLRSDNRSNYAKFGYVAPISFRVIDKKHTGAKMTPPHTRAKVNLLT